jgi:hypothetical protein
LIQLLHNFSSWARLPIINVISGVQQYGLGREPKEKPPAACVQLMACKDGEKRMVFSLSGSLREALL